MMYSPIDPDQLVNPEHRRILEEYELHLDAHRAKSTVKVRVWYAYKLCLWAESLNEDMADTTDDSSQISVWSLTYSQLARWLSRGVGPAPGTKYSARCSARLFYSWGQKAGFTQDNVALKLPSVRRPRGVPKACPEQVLEKGLWNATRRRDVFMLLLGSYAGLRACEIAPLHTRDVLLGRKLRVLGKGGHERIVPLHPIIREYLPYFEDGFFFPSDRSTTGHVLPASIGQRIRDLLDTSGWNGHTLRHRFATEVYQANPDLLALKDLLGHASVATTQIYARADVARLDEYVDALPMVKNLPRPYSAVLKAA